jgi:hypothetical protein
MSSDKRENVCQVFSCILKYMDVPTRRVGKIAPDGTYLEGITEAQVCKDTGLQPRTVNRAFRVLKSSALATVCRQFDQDEHSGRYEGRPAIRTISKLAFVLFGLEKQYENAARHIKEEQNKRAASKRAKREKQAATLLDVKAGILRTEHMSLADQLDEHDRLLQEHPPP